MWKTCRIWSSNCVDIVDTIDICNEGSEEQIKYLEMDKSGIRVAHYYTELPKPEDLQLIIKRQMIIAQQGGRNFD